MIQNKYSLRFNMTCASYRVTEMIDKKLTKEEI